MLGKPLFSKVAVGLLLLLPQPWIAITVIVTTHQPPINITIHKTRASFSNDHCWVETDRECTPRIYSKNIQAIDQQGAQSPTQGHLYQCHNSNRASSQTNTEEPPTQLHHRQFYVFRTAFIPYCSESGIIWWVQPLDNWSERFGLRAYSIKQQERSIPDLLGSSLIGLQSSAT